MVIAEGLVIGEAEHSIVAKAVEQFAQGEGEQGQGIVAAGVVHGRLHEALLHRQPRHLGRPLDDFGDALHGQGR